MSRDAAFLDYVRELIAPCGKVRARAMFGGHGVYIDDVFVAIVIDGALYLKADAETEPAFRAAGSSPFTYTATAQAIQMSYWSAPGEALESAEAMRPWARRALDAALRKERAKAKPGRRR
jgi:DNA transformation protein and related proteins